MTEREAIKRLLVSQERMRDLMIEQAAEHQHEGREESARHCAGVAEGLGIGIVSLRCILERPRDLAENWPRLSVVS